MLPAAVASRAGNKYLRGQCVKGRRVVSKVSCIAYHRAVACSMINAVSNLGELYCIGALL